MMYQFADWIQKHCWRKDIKQHFGGLQQWKPGTKFKEIFKQWQFSCMSGPQRSLITGWGLNIELTRIYEDKMKLDMSTARRRLKSPRSLSGTSAHLTMVTEVNIMVMNGWLTSFSFIVNRLPHSWDKAISDSDLETPRSRSWVWSRGKVIQLAQYHINSLPFHLTLIRSTILQIELFRNLTLKHPRSRSWGRSKVKVTYCTQYPTNALPFRFTSIGPTIPEIWPK